MAESDTVQATLASLGHTVNTFTGITASDFATALSGAEMLLIPEQEVADLAPALSADARTTIAGYVSGGGGLIVHGGGGSSAFFLNTVFGFSVSLVGSSTSSTLTGAATGTAFAGGPATIPRNSAVTALTPASLPGGSSSIYVDGTNASVALMAYGAGEIVFLGWDWYVAVPLGSQDGGWVTVLDNAVTEVTSGPANVAPSIGGTVADQGVNDNATVSPFSTVTITDPDSAAVTVTVTLDNAAQGDFTTLSGFTAIGGGVYTYSGSPGDAQAAIRGMVYDPTDNRVAPELTETTTFTVSVDDGVAEPVTDNATTVVSTSINDAPTGNNDEGETNEDTILNVAASGVLANDTDPDTGDSLNVTGYDALSAQGATVFVNADGSFSYDPTGASALQSLAAGESVVDTFSYTVSDDFGGSDTATVSITITGVNDAPTANGDSGSTNEDSAFTTGNVLANDTDPDTSDTLAVSGLDTTGTLGLVTNNGDGTFTYDPNGQFEDLAVGEQATDTFQYTVSDGNGGTNTATVTVTITGVNDQPTVNPQEFSIDENSANGASVGSVVASDPDTSDTLTYSIIGGTGSTAFAINSDTGEITVADTTQLDWEATHRFTIDVQISDGNGGADSATMTINLNDVPDPNIVLEDSVAPIYDRAMNISHVINDGAGPIVGAATFTIRNDGQIALTVNSVALAGGADFSMSGIPTTPFTIAVGESVVGTVTFDPTSNGLQAATITVQSDDNDEPSVVLNISGTGISGAPLVLSQVNPRYTFQDGDGDTVRLQYSGPGAAWVYDAAGNAPDGRDIAFVTFANTTDRTVFIAKDIDPRNTPNTMTMGVVAMNGNGSFRSLQFINPLGVVGNTDIAIGGDLKQFQVIGAATNMGLAVVGNLVTGLLNGRVADSTITIGGSATLIKTMNGLAGSSLTVGGDARCVAVQGAINNTVMDFGGNISRFFSGGGLAEGSRIHVAGATGLFHVMGGLSGESVVNLDGNVLMALIYGTPGQASVERGSMVTLGRDLTGVMLAKGEVAGSIDITRSARNAKITIAGDLTGNLLAGIFGNVMINGNFRGSIGDGDTAAGMGNSLTVKGENSGAFLPGSAIFAEIR
ncbi:MAG: Ig-like domain-containing protein [Planctomycetota bacterium]